MKDRSKLVDIIKYVVEGDDAKRVYDVLQVSYVGKNKKLPPSQGNRGYELEYRYEDGVLYIEEHTTGGWAGYIEEILCFLIHYDNFYRLWERREDGVPLFYEVVDDKGKYFVRPPKTEYELREEAEREKSQESSKRVDIPF